jgi:hypothetical protein
MIVSINAIIVVYFILGVIIAAVVLGPLTSSMMNQMGM